MRPSDLPITWSTIIVIIPVYCRCRGLRSEQGRALLDNSMCRESLMTTTGRGGLCQMEYFKRRWHVTCDEMVTKQPLNPKSDLQPPTPPREFFPRKRNQKAQIL